MERDGLRQFDLPEIGNQAKVSEVLAGKRTTNLRQAKALAGRFKVPLELFAG
jgi:HTH-type transcriptional regulator/antitoxin HigA